ncbi:MAG: hypothetical protein QG670_1315 [Thermoproteota archaeon]|nr:hypothetical protein [Thermoproteota archaeon]
MSVFEKGTCWTLFEDMEHELIHFFEYSPYTDDNSNVVSPKLLALIMQVCEYIEATFREMTKFEGFKNIREFKKMQSFEIKGYKKYNLKLAKEAFESIYHLSSNGKGEIIAKLEIGEKYLVPFSSLAQDKDMKPDWWQAPSNKTKNWLKSLEKANADNALQALAGAFLLNVVHYPSIKRLWLIGRLETVRKIGDDLKGDYLPEHIFDKTLAESALELEPFKYSYRVETALFKFAKIDGTLFVNHSQSD